MGRERFIDYVGKLSSFKRIFLFLAVFPRWRIANVLFLSPEVNFDWLYIRKC